MSSNTPQPIRREDYRVPNFLVDTIDLDFDLRDDGTTVRSRMTIRRNPDAADPGTPLELDGEDLKLTGLLLDGEALGANRYQLESERLTIRDVPDQFELAVTTEINPHQNTTLSGL